MNRTIPAEVSARLKILQQAGVENRAVRQLQYNIAKFEQDTGKYTRGAMGVLPPKGMTDRESDLYNNILESFIADTSSAEEIRKAYSRLSDSQKDYAMRDTGRKKPTLKDMAGAVDRAKLDDERMSVNAVLSSDLIREVWAMARVNKWEGRDVIYTMQDAINAMDNNVIDDDYNSVRDYIYESMRLSL